MRRRSRDGRHKPSPHIRPTWPSSRSDDWLSQSTTRRSIAGSTRWGIERIGFTAKGALDRKDFGLKWNQALETGGVLVGKTVKIELDIQAVYKDEG